MPQPDHIVKTALPALDDLDEDGDSSTIGAMGIGAMGGAFGSAAEGGGAGATAVASTSMGSNHAGFEQSHRPAAPFFSRSHNRGLPGEDIEIGTGTRI